MNTPYTAPFVWDLRLIHEGGRSLRLERRGRGFRFDPHSAPVPTEVSVLTGPWATSLDAMSTAVRSASQPTLVAEGELRAFLEGQGPVMAVKAPCSLDGVQVSLREAPVPPDEPLASRAQQALRPVRAAAHLLARSRRPRSAPQAVELRFPSGRRLVHLGLALHEGTPADWIEGVVREWGKPDWLVLGAAYGQESAAAALLPRLGAGKVLVTDLVGDERRERGLPARLLTPMVDALRRGGIDAYVFVQGASMRFEDGA